VSTRWQQTDAPRGDEYDDRWRTLEADGRPIHGEADLVDGLLDEIGGSRVLDAGCGTGRVAIELATRGVEVLGADVNPSMLAEARRKAPHITWVHSDIADLDLGRVFDVVVMAGNVPLFTPEDKRAALVAGCARHVAPDGVLIAGFQLGREVDLADYDAYCAAAGLELAERYSTWDGDPFPGDGTYALSVHRQRSGA